MTASIPKIAIDERTRWKIADAHMRQRSTFKSAAKTFFLKFSGVIDRLPADAGVLLTFDDGPDPVVTPAVLDLLARFNAKAVFFVVGNRIPRASHMLSRIVDEGHTIGNHTFRHPLGCAPKFADYYRDVMKCQSTIADLVGKPPRLFRPPLGSLTAGSLLAPRLARLKSVLWSLDVYDWKLRRDEDAVRAGGELAARATPGDIVLLHDDNPCVVTLLETALPLMSSRLEFDKSAAHLDASIA